MKTTTTPAKAQVGRRKDCPALSRRNIRKIMNDKIPLNSSARCPVSKPAPAESANSPSAIIRCRRSPVAKIAQMAINPNLPTVEKKVPTFPNSSLPAWECRKKPTTNCPPIPATARTSRAVNDSVGSRASSVWVGIAGIAPLAFQRKPMLQATQPAKPIRKLSAMLS